MQRVARDATCVAASCWRAVLRWYAWSPRRRCAPSRHRTLPHFRELDRSTSPANAADANGLSLDLPRLADNGNAVPMRIVDARAVCSRRARDGDPALLREESGAADGAFRVSRAARAHRSRLARSGSPERSGSSALAELADGELYAAVADVVVTISGCLDGT